MSQSPLDETLNPEQRYLDSWRELANRIRQGNSFSGREPNCLFLNAGGRRFADASSCAGFDLTDDSRGLAVTDWDHDGDLDVWISNRTGPRLRFLRNDLGGGEKSVALLLEGDPSKGVNRDALGTRVELVTSDGRQIRTVTAGNGFVSQSTRWLVFGLGARTVESVIVRWPNGERQMFNGAEPGGRYTIRHGQPQLRPIRKRSNAVALEAMPVDAPELTDSGRVWLRQPMELPELEFADHEGKKSALQAGGLPLLVNLWAPWCQPCLAELKAFAEHRETLSSAISLLALTVEKPDSQSRDLIANKIAFPFAHGSCDDVFVESVDKLVSQFVYRHRGIPVPFSMLIGSDHKLYAIYKGPLSVEQLIADAALVKASAEERRDAAVPFAGEWSKERFITNPVAVASVYLEDDRYAAARKYLNEKLAEERGRRENQRLTDRRVADIYFHIGRVDLAEQNLEGAVANFRKAVATNPRHLAVQTALADALSRAGGHAEAVDTIGKVAAALSKNPEVKTRQGEILARAGESEKAIEAYEECIAAQPGYPIARQRLVELLVSDPSVRDAGRAFELSKGLHRFAPGNAEIIETIALATAASGDAKVAVKMLESALSIASRSSDRPLVDRIRAKLEGIAAESR